MSIIPSITTELKIKLFFASCVAPAVGAYKKCEPTTPAQTRPKIYANDRTEIEAPTCGSAQNGSAQ